MNHNHQLISGLVTTNCSYIVCYLFQCIWCPSLQFHGHTRRTYRSISVILKAVRSHQEPWRCHQDAISLYISLSIY